MVVSSKERKIDNHNRLVRYHARKKVENRLAKQFGGDKKAREKAQKFMKGKHVHHTGRGLELCSNKSKHGSKHGSGRKGPPRVYRRKRKK